MSADGGTHGTGTVERDPIAGRDREITTLTAFLNAIAAGRPGPGALVVRGAFGSGRTTLATGAIARAATGLRIVHTAGVAAESRWPGAGLHRLAAQLGRPPPHLRLPNGHPDPADGDAALALLTGAGGPPTVCLVDDADDLDHASLELLAWAGRRLPGPGLGLLLIAGPRRSGPLPGIAASPGDLRCLDGLAEIALDPLPESDSRLMATRLLTRQSGLDAGDLPADVLAAVVDLADGNPLAIAEIAGSIGGGQLYGDDALPRALPIDGRLRAHHRTLLGRLEPEVRLAALIAAVQQPIEVPVAVAAVTQAGLEPGRIDEAAALGLIRIDGDRVDVPDHLLAASICCEATVVHRLSAHRALAAALDHDAARLDRAWHSALAQTDAGRLATDQLASELEAAARVAAAAGDAAGASRGLERAAELGREPGTAAGRLAEAGEAAWRAGDVRRARLLLARARRMHLSPALRSSVDLLLGEIELRSGSATQAYEALTVVADGLAGPSSGQAVSALLRTSEMLMLAGDHPRFLSMAHRIGHEPIPDESACTRLVFEQFEGFSASFVGEHRRSAQPLRTVMKLAPETRDPSALILGTIAGITVCDEAETQALAEQAVRQARTSTDRAHLPVALEYLAFAHFLRGQYASARAHAQDGLARAERAGQDNCVAACLATLALLSAVAGDQDAPLARAQVAARKADGRGLCRPRALTIWASVRMALAHGRTGDAVTALRAAWSSPRPASPAQPYGMHLTIRVMATPDLLEAAVLHGDPAPAIAALGHFRAWATQMDSASNLSLLARCEALVTSDEDHADELFRRSLQLRDDRGLDFERARTQLLYGRALRRRRRPAKARTQLGEALQVFDGIGAHAWAAQARGELRAAGGGVTARPMTGLTPQQHQIAKLVAEGATNREIAAQLFLSPRTVDHHLRNIFVRLGVRSRTELARVVS